MNNKLIKEDEDRYPDSLENDDDKISLSTELPIVEELNQNKTIKEINIILDTGTEGRVECITPEINGELVGVIVDSKNMFYLKIEIEKYKLVLYEKQGFKGPKYLGLVSDCFYSNGEVVQNSNKNYSLNDYLKITVDGAHNTKINFSVRYK